MTSAECWHSQKKKDKIAAVGDQSAVPRAAVHVIVANCARVRTAVVNRCINICNSHAPSRRIVTQKSTSERYREYGARRNWHVRSVVLSAARYFPGTTDRRERQRRKWRKRCEFERRKIYREITHGGMQMKARARLIERERRQETAFLSGHAYLRGSVAEAWKNARCSSSRGSRRGPWILPNNSRINIRGAEFRRPTHNRAIFRRTRIVAVA